MRPNSSPFVVFTFGLTIESIKKLGGASLAHKASDYNILFEDFFCDYRGKEGHREAVCFANFPKWK